MSRLTKIASLAVLLLATAPVSHAGEMSLRVVTSRDASHGAKSALVGRTKPSVLGWLRGERARDVLLDKQSLTPKSLAYPHIKFDAKGRLVGGARFSPTKTQLDEKTGAPTHYISRVGMPFVDPPASREHVRPVGEQWPRY